MSFHHMPSMLCLEGRILFPLASLTSSFPSWQASRKSSLTHHVPSPPHPQLIICFQLSPLRRRHGRQVVSGAVSWSLSHFLVSILLDLSVA